MKKETQRNDNFDPGSKETAGQAEDIRTETEFKYVPGNPIKMSIWANNDSTLRIRKVIAHGETGE